MLAPAATRCATGRQFGHWAAVPMTGLDPIKALTETFLKDPAKVKYTLGEGVYRNNDGKPELLKSVQLAERKIIDSGLDHEYAPVPGIAAFCKTTAKFTFGPAYTENLAKRTASVQSLSGTGALRLAGAFLNQEGPRKAGAAILMPNPTWANHKNIFAASGLTPASYRYFDKKSNGLDFKGMAEDIRNAPEKSIILLHACAHNPTGIDPSQAQWQELSKICKERNHVIFFDNAYQGFASGDPDRDAYAFRQFANDGHQLIVAQSFAKNFGLYGERVGALHIVCENADEAERVDSQLKVIIRAMYSNPPIHGARIVNTILSDPELKKIWEQDVRRMADRMNGMRQALVDELKKSGSTKNWQHITDQIGMFAYSGMSEAQVDRLAKEYHVYLTKDGRMSIAGLNTNNLPYIAKAFHEVTK